MGNTTLTIGGTLEDESASVYTTLDSLQFTDAASSLGSWSATLPVERSFSDSLFDEIYIYDDNTILFQGELESFETEYAAGTTTISGRGALVALTRRTQSVTYENTTVYDALQDAWTLTPYDVGVLPPNRDLYDRTFASNNGHRSLWSWSGDTGASTLTDGVTVERNRLVFTQPNTLLDDTNDGLQQPSMYLDTPANRLGFIIETVSPITTLEVGLKRMDGNTPVETVWDTATHDTPQRFHYFDFEFSQADDRFRPALEIGDELVEVQRTEAFAPDPAGFVEIDGVEIDGTVFEILQELHDIGSYEFAVRNYETLDVTSFPTGTVVGEPNWTVTSSTRSLDFTEYANKVTVHGRTRDDGTVATATRKSQSEIDELAARGVGDDGVIQDFEKNPDLKTQAEVDSRAERLLAESITERDESGTLEIAPLHVAPGFSYPVSAWGDAFPYGTQIGANSLYFDGDSYVEFDFSHQFGGPEGGVWTTELLLHPDNLFGLGDDEYQTLVRIEDEIERRVIRLYGDGSIEFGNPAGSSGISRTASGVIQDAQTQRLSVVWNQTPDPRRVYVDGQLEAEFTDYYAVPLSTDDPLTYRLGADFAGNHGYQGGMDDVRFWADSEPRSQQQIADYRETDLIESEVNLTALPIYFRFDDKTEHGTVVNDGNAVDYNATLVKAEYQDAVGQLDEVQYSLGSGETVSLDFDISGRIDTELIETQRASRSNRRTL